VAESLGVSRSWLYDSGLAGELRFWRSGKVRLVLVSELERAIARLSARWDEGHSRQQTKRAERRKNVPGPGIDPQGGSTHHEA
jgi:hypothetical protein